MRPEASGLEQAPGETSHILRLGAYATDELHIPPDVFDPALDEVNFGGEQTHAGRHWRAENHPSLTQHA